MWSKDPWDIPIVSIRNKHTEGEMIKILTWSIISEKTLANKKKTKEWYRFIFWI